MLRVAPFTTFVAILLFGGNAGAVERITLRAVGDGCPSADLVRRQLVPLVEPRPIELVSSAEASAVVEDQGDRYSIVVGGDRRDVTDASRNCLERARVAAVFIAMNLPVKAQESPAAKPPTPAPSPASPPPEPELEPEAEPAPPPVWRFGVQGRFGTSLAPEHGALALGVNAGPTVSVAHWEIALSFGFSGPTTVSGLGPSRAESVELLRFPVRLTLAHLWSIGSLELGPELGAFAGLLRIRGDNVPEPETSLRFDGGVSAGVISRWRARDDLAVGVGADFLYSPYRYDLLVGPERKLGETPAVWLNFGASLAYNL